MQFYYRQQEPAVNSFLLGCASVSRTNIVSCLLNNWFDWEATADLEGHRSYLVYFEYNSGALALRRKNRSPEQEQLEWRNHSIQVVCPSWRVDQNFLGLVPRVTLYSFIFVPRANLRRPDISIHNVLTDHHAWRCFHVIACIARSFHRMKDAECRCYSPCTYQPRYPCSISWHSQHSWPSDHG